MRLPFSIFSRSRRRIILSFTIPFVAALMVGVAQSVRAQVPQKVISDLCSSCEPTSVHAADLDGDGDRDVLAASAVDDKITWFENDGAADPSFTIHTITTNADGAQSVYVADVDGDTDIDVLSASANDDKIAWYENDGATDPSFTSRVISVNADGAASVYAADVDGDTDIDVLSASTNDDKIAWYENDGAADPAFSAHNLSTSATYFRSVRAADVDGDSDTDIVSGSGQKGSGGQIFWYENDGNADPSFTADKLAATLNGVEEISVVDLDNDTDTDILYTYGNAFGERIGWLESDGASNPSFDPGIISSDGARSIFATNVDGDSDTDILAAPQRGEAIAWYENNGNTDPSFTAHTITTEVSNTVSVFAADVDDDSNVDFLSASSVDNKVAFYENNGSGFDAQHVLSNLSDAAQPQSVRTADINDDSHIDVLSASNGDDKIAWYENDGTESFTAHTITTSAEFARSVDAANLNGDTNVDVVSAAPGNGEITWYENDGSGSFTTHAIATGTVASNSVHAADVDGDTNTDVLSSGDNTVAWYENDGSGSFTAHTITTSVNDALSVHAADVDGDGHTDVLSANYFDDEIAWYENDGSGSFTAQTVAPDVQRPQSVYAADIDGDTDIDVLSSWGTSSRGGIMWYENDGNANFTAHTAASDNQKPQSVYAADVDGDGDTDILSAGDNTVAWYENNGSGGFVAHTITTSVIGARSVYAADVGGDSDIDVLSASADDDKIAWYENTAATFSPPPTVTSVTLGNDGSDRLTLSVQTNQPLGSSASDLVVTVDGPSTTDVYNFDRTDFSENGSGPYTYTLKTTQGYEDGDGTYTASVDDALNLDGKDGADGSQTDSYLLDTTPPTITNVYLANDGNDNLRFEFDSDEDLGDDAADVTVSVDGPNTNDVYVFDRTDFNEYLYSGRFIYQLQTTQAFDDGAGTYTASVDDAFDPRGNNGGNNGAGSGLNWSHTFEANVTLVDGRDGAAYNPPAASPGTNDNPVGRFELSADVSGAELSSVTITQEGFTPGGVSSIELWRSSDNTFESGSDTEIASKSYADNVSFSSISPSIPTGGRYVFVVVDLAGDASGDYSPKIASESDITFAAGALSTVNGTSTSSFTDAYLSSSSSPLPVELADFTAETSEHNVVLKWRTASEKNNVGFQVQHRADSTAAWQKVGFVESKAEGGTTTEAQSYRFVPDDDLNPGTHRFRLKQVDLDGTTHVHDPVKVDVTMQQPLLLTTPAPHPVQNQATLSFAVKEAQETTITLYNVLGQQVRTLYRGTPTAGEAQSLRIDAGDLASGTYVVRLRAADRTKIQRVTVVH